MKQPFNEVKRGNYSLNTKTTVFVFVVIDASPIEPSTITCDNIGSVDLVVLTATQLEGLSDDIYQNCPDILGSTDGFTGEQLGVMAAGFKKVGINLFWYFLVHMYGGS